MTAREPPQSQSLDDKTDPVPDSASETKSGLARAVEQADTESDQSATRTDRAESTTKPQQTADSAVSADATTTASQQNGSSALGATTPTTQTGTTPPTTQRPATQTEPTATPAGTTQYTPQTKPSGTVAQTVEQFDLDITEGEAKILPFLFALGGFFLLSGTDLRFGLLMGAMLMIIVVSGEFVVRLGGEFLEKIERYL